MGCASSSKAKPRQQFQSPPRTLLQPGPIPVDGLILKPASHPGRGGSPGPHALGKGRGKGKGSDDPKGKGKGGVKGWQIMLENKWQDYGKQEDAILKRAWMTGQNNAKFHLRGQSYEYSFKRMVQKNLDSNKERRIRPPLGPRPPKKPLLPQGAMIIITVGTGQPGTMIPVKDVNNPGQIVQVYVPSHAKVGQKLAVPIPAKGESVESVQEKQKKHDEEYGTKTATWTTGAKVGAGAAAVAAVGVGGVILGDHLAGGDMADTIGEAAIDGIDAAGDWASGAADDAGEWFADDAGEDIADFVADAGEWFGDAGEDIGDFVMDLF